MSDQVSYFRISDPTAVKPVDWDETAPPFVADKGAKMPEGWLSSESEMIPDPSARKPETWDDTKDGLWESPLIRNYILVRSNLQLIQNARWVVANGYRR
jgi:calnexin